MNKKLINALSTISKERKAWNELSDKNHDNKQWEAMNYYTGKTEGSLLTESILMQAIKNKKETPELLEIITMQVIEDCKQNAIGISRYHMQEARLNYSKIYEFDDDLRDKICNIILDLQLKIYDSINEIIDKQKSRTMCIINEETK